jgi:AraC-like DNA-binding protein
MRNTPCFEIDLGQRPKIVEVELCRHGSRSAESFRLYGLWSLHAYHYRGEFCLNGKSFPFKAGCVSLIPPETLVEWRFPTDAPHYYAHFEMESSCGIRVELPLLQDLGEDFDLFCGQFEQLIHFQTFDPERARIRLWDMLYQLKGKSATVPSTQRLHPSLQIALGTIRNRQSENIHVGRIARSMGVSHNHLTHLFLRYLGCGARECIQRERLKHACHLLAHSSLSIKSVAIATGIPDLHYCNKLVHKATGESPRDYRRNRSRTDLLREPK